MKKVSYLLLCLGLFLIPVFPVLALGNDDIMLINETGSEATTLIPNAKSGLLMEASTGKILFEKNIDEQISVASMTKMMSQILILEENERGNLPWDEKVTVSSNASGMGGSQIWLETGEVMSIRDLMKGLSMASANDATVALAERVAGTEAAFVERMNEKAKELGLTNTHFMNSTGLDEENHYSSARDMAIIVKELLKHEQIFDFSSVYEDYLRVDTPNKFWLVNTNKLIRTYPGADGLKTGHTDNALYCMAVTAKKDNLRLVALVFGEENSKVRNSETAALLDYGFNLYKMQLLKQKGEVLSDIEMDLSDKGKVSIVAMDDIGVVTKKSEKMENVTTELEMFSLDLPLKPGDVVGKVILKQNNEILGEYPVTVQEEINRIGFFSLFGRVLKGMFSF